MQSDASEQIKARARLALRAERAMGVLSLPIALTRATKPQATPAAPARAPAPRVEAPRAPAPAPPPVRAQPSKQTIFPLPTAPAFVLPTEPFTEPVMSRQGKLDALQALNQSVSGCQKCRLHEHRTHTVFGEGDPDAKIMFIGEGPGETEDQQGRPFVGKAGQLLEKMIGAMGLKREQVYICNLVKCRPPGNREPAADETGVCTEYLLRQVEIVRPHVIVTLGRPATQFILQSKLSMSRLRGQWHEWRGIKVMPTYHPAYVLRQYTRETREAVWSDLKQVIEALGMSLPKRASE